MVKTKFAGKFITFEGGEGTGKSTQTVLLAESLNNLGHKVILTREPGGSEGAELIRALVVSGDVNRWSPMTEMLLLYAARADHWQKIIEPALQRGDWVICDRFADSTLAYQGYGHGLNRSFINKIYTEILKDVQPDWTFIFDLDPKMGVERALKRHTGKVHDETRFENMDMAFHQRVREGFLEIASENPHRCHVVDASHSIYAIHRQIVKITLRNKV
jgi:dTMP kinase